ncbi:MAG: hypothetical protein IPM97_02230 [Bdellovibrionaceae bacterium]|nr:hypothetical protein [Pseudobdellovibrionaceae bacterium]
MKLKNIRTLLLLISSIGLVLFFQNCANTKMQFSAGVTALSMSFGADESFLTNEDEALFARPVQTLKEANGGVSAFSLTSQAANGIVSDFNANDGSFKYMPNAAYVGDDAFEYSELNSDKVGAVTRRISITVQPVYQKPWLENKVFNFPMNSVDNPIALVGKDKKDPNPRVLLDLKGFVTQVNTKYGVAKKVADGQFTYTPQNLFRGIDSLEVFVVNSAGLHVQQAVTINVGNPFLNLEPALAVRAPACMNCHSSVASRFITDFGFGNTYFFGKSGNPFSSAPIDFYADHGKSWSTANFESDVILPKANIGLDLASLAGSNYAGVENSATTVGDYIRAIEAKKAKPAKVVEKDSVYIGTPTDTLLNTRTGGTAGAAFKYVKNDTGVSPALSGLVDQGAYLEASNLICDGDLLISKTLYLKDLVLKTAVGCRIYSTQSIFVQGPISYEKLDANATDNGNLQLVSTRWVNLGVGDTHCETSTNTGWYSQNTTTMKMKPTEHRILTYAGPTRANQTVAASSAYNQSLLTELRKIPSFQDASCRKVSSGKPRDVHFERLLINAPRVDSRYSGKFTGVIVSEVPLMSLSVFSFSYDTVFNRVPVLPLLKAEDFLVIK